MQQLQNFTFYVVFQKALMFYNPIYVISVVQQLFKMLYNKQIFYFVKSIITIPQHMKLALKFDILHLIALQIVI